ncbi:MAG: NUDIX hydrolase [Bacillota bacterium]
MANYVQELRKSIGTKPIILVGSTIVVFNEKKEILLQHCSDRNAWGLPGGAMELGESLEETARQKLYEETGLTAKVFEFIDVLSSKDLNDQYPYGVEVYNIVALYKAKEVTGNLLMEDGESLDLRYFSLNNLPFPLEDRAKIILENYFIES